MSLSHKENSGPWVGIGVVAQEGIGEGWCWCAQGPSGSLWLAAHRGAHDARPWRRTVISAGPRTVLLLRWMVAGTALMTPARDSRVSRATVYRYPLRCLGGDRRPGPGTSRGPSATAPVRGAKREPGRDPDPHRPGGSAQPRNGPSSVVLRS